MTPAKKPAKRRKLPPQVQQVGAVGALVMLLGGLGTLVLKYPRATCRVADALCEEHQEKREEAPKPTTTAPIPLEPLPEQVRARDGACPEGYRAIHGGCWLLADRRPPCPFHAYEHEGRCWSALYLSKRLPSVEEPRKPHGGPW